MRNLWFFAGIIILSGCMTVRSYTKEEPRKDLDIEGNQGYLSGESKEGPRENRLGDTRSISVVEVEFGRSPADGFEGGWVSRGKRYKGQPVGEDIEFSSEQAPEYAAEPSLKGPREVKYYKIEKNDTLQKISHKFYGTTRKWNILYKVNQDVLKSPDTLRLGVEIKIPPLN